MNTRHPRAAFLRALATLALVTALAACSELEGDSDVPAGDTSGDTTDGPSARFQALYNGYFQTCRECHTPAGLGRTSETEQTLDFTTAQTAYDTLTMGSASGMVGNVEACNGVPFIGSTYQQSLVAATIDENVRATFQATGQGPCDEATVTDMTLKTAEGPSPAFLADLKDWIDAGAP